MNQFLTQSVAKVVFDATAKTTLRPVADYAMGVYIPAGAVITNAYYVVNTTFTSTAGGTDLATLALTVESAGDLKAAISIAASGDVWDAGVHGCLPGSYAEATVAGDTAILDAARKAASYILTTVEREVTISVATQALTGGKLTLYIEYAL